MGLTACVSLAAVALACDLLAPADGPPTYSQVPDFELIDRRGNVFTREDLRGTVFVANFIFASCTSMCPMLSSEMARLQHTLQQEPFWDEIRLVSISVDPGHDTPAVLAEYADRYDADPEHWRFLTGAREEIWSLSVDGFKLAVGDAPAGADEPLFHSDRFVLADREGRIRGYYEALSPDGRKKLLADLRAVVGAAAETSSAPGLPR